MNRLQEKIIATLLQVPEKKLEFWQLVRRTGYMLDVVTALEALQQAGLVSLSDSMVTLTGSDIPDHLAARFPPLPEIMKTYLSYRKQVEFSSESLDQLALLPQGIERKLSIMMTKGDVRNRDILCLGDDDLFSIACSLTCLPKSVTVFDADEKLIAFLKKVSPDLPVPIQAVALNFLNAIPDEHTKSYDVFITEPPDTLKGTLLFVSRGISCLRDEGILYLGITEETLNRKQWRDIQQSILDSGLAITDIYRDCEVYEIIGDELQWKGYDKLPAWINKPATTPWYVSALVRAESTGSLTPAPISFKDVEKELITSFSQ
jgi:predicted methyltransferase